MMALLIPTLILRTIVGVVVEIIEIITLIIT
jgi:hypothetical protein